jgi:gamma-glutamyltranspeptidase / glutathione hydrolase
MSCGASDRLLFCTEKVLTMNVLAGTAYGVRRIAHLKSCSSFFNAARRILHIIPVLLLTLFYSPGTQAATGEKAMVVSPDPRATQAALEVLQNGGNAVDAAVAAQWLLNVVAPQASGIGGGGLCLFYDVGTRRILSYDGSVKAPRGAFSAMFLDEHQRPLPYQPERNTGGLSVGVPGLLKLMEEVHGKYGTHKFSMEKLIEPAIQHAEKGVKVSAALASAIENHASRLGLADPEKKVFFENGIPLKEGQECLQPEMVKALRSIQSQGADVFYKGTIAKAISRIVQKNPVSAGYLTFKDLQNYTAVMRESVHVPYQGYDLFSAGPPADGGIMLFRGLKLLSALNSAAYGQSPEFYHVLGEVQKVALSHRAGVADPDLFDVPTQSLLSEDWAEKWAQTIKIDEVLRAVAEKSQVPEAGRGHSGSSILVVDSQGNMVVLVATLGDPFGSAMRVPGYGFFLNDQLADFSPESLKAEDPQNASVISSGQRPRGVEAPIFMFKDGKPFGLLSAYGQEDPAAVLLNVIAQKIDLRASCVGAMEAPRLLVRARTLRMEPGLYENETIRLKLALLGHDIGKEDRIGVAQMICFDEGSGRIEGVSDPRSGGDAAGF